VVCDSALQLKSSTIAIAELRHETDSHFNPGRAARPKLETTAESTLLFLGWLEEHNLGRKRLLDPMLASF
jgi:hypothetical protein